MLRFVVENVLHKDVASLETTRESHEACEALRSVSDMVALAQPPEEVYGDCGTQWQGAMLVKPQMAADFLPSFLSSIASWRGRAAQVPFLFKYAIDGLTMDPSGATAVAVPMTQLIPATLLLGYGAARAGSALCNEVRNAIFAKVRAAAGSCTFI